MVMLLKSYVDIIVYSLALTVSMPIDMSRTLIKLIGVFYYSILYHHYFSWQLIFFFPVPVCAITALGVPGGTFVSMNRFSTLWG
jgi:hypothetical protein